MGPQLLLPIPTITTRVIINALMGAITENIQTQELIQCSHIPHMIILVNDLTSPIHLLTHRDMYARSLSDQSLAVFHHTIVETVVTREGAVVDLEVNHRSAKCIPLVIDQALDRVHIPIRL